MAQEKIKEPVPEFKAEYKEIKVGEKVEEVELTLSGHWMISRTAADILRDKKEEIMKIPGCKKIKFIFEKYFENSVKTEAKKIGALYDNLIENFPLDFEMYTESNIFDLWWGNNKNPIRIKNISPQKNNSESDNSENVVG